MKIYIARHGDAVSEAVDITRPLSPQGVAVTKKMAAFLKSSGVSVTGIYHSTKRRAVETAEIFKAALNPSLPMTVKEYLLPEGNVEEAFRDVERWRKDTLVVSHLPFVERLVTRCLCRKEGGGSMRFLESSVAVLARGDDRSWVLDTFITPETLN